jgi:formate/nitrite transporter FocA (FNT family)
MADSLDLHRTPVFKNMPQMALEEINTLCNFIDNLEPVMVGNIISNKKTAPY